MTSNNSQELSLLSNTELEWLLGKKQLSKTFGYKIKSTIKKKIDNFLNFELPLLIQNEILDKQSIQDIIDKPDNVLLSLGKEKVAGPKVCKHAGIPAQGYVFRNNENEIHIVDSNFDYNSQNKILPNTVRFSLPTKRYTRLSLQDINDTCNFNNDFWKSFEEYLTIIIGKVGSNLDSYMQRNIMKLV